MRFYIYIFVFLLTYVLANAQSADPSMYRLAESFEQSGDFEKASAIYKDLWTRNPANTDYFQGLVRTYKGLNRYSDLMPVIQKYVSLRKTPESLSLLAEMLWRTGDNKGANETWAAAIDIDPKSTQTWQAVAESQLTLQLFEKAIETLEEGRNQIKNYSIFGDLLSQLYIAKGDYEKGTREVLNAFTQSYNISQTQGRLAAIMTSDQAIKHIGSRLADFSKSYSNNVAFLQLYAWYFRSIGNQQKAFDIFKEIDKMSYANGRELIRFAYDSQRDGKIDIALIAFEYVIDHFDNKSQKLNALYGYIRTLEEKIFLDGKLDNNLVKNIIDRYKSVIDEFPNTATAADCYYRIAVLYNEKIHDNSKAKQFLDIMLKDYANQAVAADASILLGKIYMAENNFEDAKRIFTRVLATYGRNMPHQLHSALYNLALMEFFSGEIDSAAEHFTQLSNFSSSDVANDALEKSILINVNKNDNDAIIIFGKAEMKNFQNDVEQAESLYRAVIESAPESDLAERAYIEIAELAAIKKNYSTAITELDKFIEKYPQTIYADKSLMLQGDNFLELKEYENAIKKYKQVLTDYPSSIYLSEARNKIRLLRDGKPS